MTAYLRRGALALAIGALADGGGDVVVASPEDPDGGVDVGDGIISVS